MCISHIKMYVTFKILKTLDSFIFLLKWIRIFFSPDDFKPASVDKNKMATIDVGTNSQITVSFPPNLIFKGSSKPYYKHGIVIVNPETGEVTLEKLTCNISVKKIRFNFFFIYTSQYQK